MVRKKREGRKKGRRNPGWDSGTWESKPTLNPIKGNTLTMEFPATCSLLFGKHC